MYSWIGDPARVIMSKAVVGEILDKNLVEQCVSRYSHRRTCDSTSNTNTGMQARVGDALYAEMEKLASQYPDLVENLRGKNRGTYIAFDTKDAAGLVKAMKAIGVNVGTCGTRTVRLRPMLIFDDSHSKSHLITPKLHVLHILIVIF